MTVLPGSFSVLELGGQGLHCRLAVVFWKVSAGNSGQKRVRLLPRNLQVSQVWHVSVESRS